MNEYEKSLQRKRSCMMRQDVFAERLFLIVPASGETVSGSLRNKGCGHDLFYELKKSVCSSLMLDLILLSIGVHAATSLTSYCLHDS
ncbi:hypothetical protein SAEN111111_09230 [Saccharibacillus endophyticus]